MKLNLQLCCLLAAGLAAAPSLSAADKSLADLFPDPALVKGKGFEVKRSDLDEAIANVKADALSKGQDLPPERMPLVETKLLDHLVQVQLLKRQATEADRAKAKTETERRTALIKKQFPEDALVKQLKARGMNLEKFYARLEDEALFETMLRGKLTLTDAQVRKYYEDHPDRFEDPEMLRASHILIRTRDPRSGAELSDEEKRAKKKQLEGLLKRARAGEDFTALARQFSEDPAAKENGGEYKFPRGAFRLPEFDAAAFSMQTNQISDVVSTAYGYHIIKLHEKIPARHLEFAKVSAELRLFMEQVEIERLLPGLYKQWKEQAAVEFLDERYKSLEAQVVELSEKAALEADKALTPK